MIEQSVEDKIRDLNLSKDEGQWLAEAIYYGELPEKALLEPETYLQFLKRIPVAVHEVGHEITAWWVNWGVKLTSVIPQGNIRGFTELVINWSQDRKSLIRNSGVVSAGGRAAENHFGFSHQGCAGDDGQIARLGLAGDSSIRSDAGKAVSNYGIANLRYRALRLAVRRETTS